MEKFINHTHYSKELILESYREFLKVKHKLRNIVSLIVGCLLLFFCFVYLSELFRGLRAFNINYFIFIFISLGLIWSAFWGYTSVARRTYDGMLQKGLSMDMNYKFKDDGFEVDTTDEVFNVKWIHCSFSVLTNDLCLITVKKQFYAVDLHGFTKGSAKDFSEFVRQRTRMVLVKPKK